MQNANSERGREEKRKTVFLAYFFLGKNLLETGLIRSPGHACHAMAPPLSLTLSACLTFGQFILSINK